MPLSINTIKPSRGTEKKRKRIGRGNASGTGTYAGKGLKGQNSRSGVSGLKRKGMKQILLKTPKKRGFTSLQEKAKAINLSAISDTYKDGETVNLSTLRKKGLLASAKKRVKILAQGDLKLSGLNFESLDMSQTAQEKIKKSGSKISKK